MNKCALFTLLMCMPALWAADQPFFLKGQDPAPDGQAWEPIEQLSDEFEGDALDRTKWQDEPVGNGWNWVGRPPGLFKASNVTVKDGRMRVTVGKLEKPVVMKGKTFTHQGAIVRSLHPGRLGWYFECRMKANQTAMSSTFWLMTRGHSKKKLELDIQECVGRTTEKTESWAKRWDQIFHSNAIHRRNRHNPEKVQLQAQMKTPTRNHERFYVYGAWWKSPEEIRFYLDGRYAYSIHPKVAWDVPAHIQMAIETYDWNPLPDDGGLVASGTWEQRTTQYEWVRTWKLTDSAAEAPRVVTCAAPEGENLSKDYKVWAGGKPVDVYTARVLDPPFAGKHWDYGGPYSFANFDMSGIVTVKITSPKNLDRVVVRPSSTAVTLKRQDSHTVLLTFKSPRKVSIEPDGKKGPLLLFANPMMADPPKREDPKVIHFGPGIHAPDKIVLGSGQTLYLAGGAVVKAEVLVKGDNIRICGRGILDGSKWAWRTGPVGNLIALRNSRHVTISGITLRGASHWSIVPVHCAHVTVRNVKLCNSRVQNDDGINPCNTRNMLITDCFIRSDDDCIAMKGLSFQGGDSNVENIVVENSILWCDRARIFLLGHESRAAYMRNIRLRNLDIIHFTMTPFLFEPGEDMKLEDVIVENVRLYGEGQREFIRLRPVVNQYMRNKVPGHVRNIRFKNITLQGAPGEYLVQVMGADEKHRVRDVSFEDMTIRGGKLTSTSSHVRRGKHTDGIRFIQKKP